VRESMAEIERTQGLARRGLIFKLLSALKQICNHPAHYLKQRGPLAGRSGKLAALDELLVVILDEGESTLVFTQYVGMGRLLESHLHAGGIDSLFLHGAVPVRQRDEMVAAFQRGTVPVFILSLKVGGVGLNLTRATHVLHYDRWWNPAVEDQATDRAYRIGQDRPVQVHRLVTEGTVEDRIAALLVQKRELAEAVVGAGEAWITELSNRELRDLVSLRQAV
jgi:SNF2 family DNA or RNA helicase